MKPASVTPIGLCESCGQSKVIWEVELIADGASLLGREPVDVYRLCWDCVPDADDDAWRIREDDE